MRRSDAGALLDSEKGQSIATVGAADADAAIRKAIEDYGIADPHRWRRFVAQPLE